MQMRMRVGKRTIIGTAIGVGVIALGALTYYQLLKAGIVHYGKYDRREQGTLRVGSVAPDLDLTMYDGSPVRLSHLWHGRPLFVVFGSCT